MSDDNMTKTTVRVNEQSLKRAKDKLPHGGISDLVREQINRVANNEDMAKRMRLREKLRQLRDDREDKKKDREAINREITDLNRKIERTEEQLEALGDPESEYKGHLDSILSNMRENGSNVFVGHGAIEDAARAGGKTQEEVIEDLKDMSDMKESRFETLRP